MNTRLNRLIDVFCEGDLDVLILTDGYNINYLSGYRGHCGLMVVTKKRKAIFTDSRYTEQLEKEAPDFECIDITIEGYSKNLINFFGQQFGTPNSKIKIGFENEEISYRQYNEIKKVLDLVFEKKYELLELKDKINKLREVKDEKEIIYIEKAEEIGDKAFYHMIEYIRPGMTEKQVALELEYTMKSLGASGLSFDTIAASGENSSLPHAVPTDRILCEGDLLTMDFGCIFEGYCSDMTRTVFIGKSISEEKKLVYDTVLKAQLAALSMMKPGAKCSDVDAVARNIIADAGYGEYFGHGLGHSVGLFIHEEPRCSRKCDTILKPGMTMTCEPGIYLPGKFGVRIEDLVVITEGGHINLSKSPKELLYIM